MAAVSAGRPLPAARAAWFAALAALVYAVEITLVHSPRFAARPDLLSGAVAADLLITVPALFWWLMIRPGHASWRALLAVVALSALGARLVLPAGHRDVVGLARFATAPFELGLLAYAVVYTRRALQWASAGGARAGADVADVLERALVAVLGDRLPARMLAAETATLYYALRRGGSTPRPDAAAFSHHGARPGAMLWGLSMVVLVEAGVLHLLLGGSHPAVAWGATFLSAYSVLWLVGHARAMAARRTVLEPDALVVRVGLRLAARLPLAELRAVERVTWRTKPARGAGYLDAARPLDPNVVLTLRAPKAVTVALGLRRDAARIGLRVDDPDRFVAAVGAAMHQR